MSAALGALYSRRSRNGALWAALALSLALHALMMLGWLPLHPPQTLSSVGDPEAGKRGGTSPPLAVRMAPSHIILGAEPVTPSMPLAARPRAAQRAEAPKRASPAPLAARSPTALASLPPPSPDARSGEGRDFMADLAARRRTREQAEGREQAAPAAAASAAAPLSFGTAKGSGGLSPDGGLFRVERMSATEATLAFDRLNRGTQRVDVGIGNHLSIQLAIVREVIAVMRSNGFTGDVTWMSPRLGRDVQLSARERDSVQLEAFLLLEFFSADPIRRPPDTAATR
jgi:hypothetical protein